MDDVTQRVFDLARGCIDELEKQKQYIQLLEEYIEEIESGVEVSAVKPVQLEQPWKWREQMTTWTTEDRVLCVAEMQKEIKELQDQLVIANTELTIAMAEVAALRHQLITATQSKH